MSELNQFKAEFFKALSHPLRIRILDELRKGEAGVNVLSTRLDIEQSSQSQQLSILRTRNLVLTRKEGQNVLYSASESGHLSPAGHNQEDLQQAACRCSQHA